ncbi:MAG: hypothetical protein K0S21_280 [Rhizobiaceae bacterium]|jgi:hypothetical protein|nr:hypothetical protein [Rhizobiaceae bacterium]
MASFTLTDLGDRSGEVIEAPFSGAQRAHRADALTGAERTEFLAGLDAVARMVAR